MNATNLYVGQKFLNENTAFNYEESEKNTIIEIKGKSVVLSCTSCFGTFIVTKRIDKVINLVNNKDWKIL